MLCSTVHTMRLNLFYKATTKSPEKKERNTKDVEEREFKEGRSGSRI